MQFRDPRTRWQFLPGRRLLFEELERRDLLAVMRIVDWNTLNGPNDATGDANFQHRSPSHRQRNGAGQHPARSISSLCRKPIRPVQWRLDHPSPRRPQHSVPNDQLQPLRVAGRRRRRQHRLRLRHVDRIAVGVCPDRLGHADAQRHARQVPAGRFTCLQHLLRLFGPSEIGRHQLRCNAPRQRSRVSPRGCRRARRRHAGADGRRLQYERAPSRRGPISLRPAAASCKMLPNAPGNWPDNAAFKSLHSQDPRRTTMDDRFDIQFASANSSTAPASTTSATRFTSLEITERTRSTGTITTGTGASTAVLNALVAASDHLAGRRRLQDSRVYAQRANQRNDGRHQSGRGRVVRHVSGRAQHGAHVERRRHRYRPIRRSTSAAAPACQCS